uniref:Uncharacterized protein n=1 Tax=Compsopogon caeruleus TaxID=31354 RepID=A0A7S1XFJ5_9RHOD|mmetsp:Transcript_6518/g.13108  ORF Transcript_6518/g.13108 Transcript_6518/m.13108 type:complete len:415 (+) Transcript_6518:96-1340(+)
MTDDSERREARRLREKAEGSLISRLRSVDARGLGSGEGVSERLRHSLNNLDGRDIIRRNTSRRNRYLVIFPGALQVPRSAASSTASKDRERLEIGRLENLNSKTPRLILGLDHNGSQVELRGTMVRLRRPFLSMRQTSAGLICEDVFDMVLIFPEWRMNRFHRTTEQWEEKLSGRLWKSHDRRPGDGPNHVEENLPAEEQPEVAFSRQGGTLVDHANKIPSGQSGGRKRRLRETVLVDDDSTDDNFEELELDTNEDDFEKSSVPNPPPAIKRPRRVAAGKISQLREVSSEDEEEEEEDEEDEDLAEIVDLTEMPSEVGRGGSELDVPDPVPLDSPSSESRLLDLNNEDSPSLKSHLLDLNETKVESKLTNESEHMNNSESRRKSRRLAAASRKKLSYPDISSDERFGEESENKD